METQVYKSIFLDYLSDKIIENKKLNEPKNLYDPIHYILQIGGKRIRPITTLMSCNLFGGDLKKALPAALSVEMFHNFTLIHDDIMDKASLRRGKETVHTKWDENVGILSGDALMILSYQMLEKYEGKVFSKIYTLFNETALQICEGQQYDMDFETRNDVSLDEYIKMISYKTAVLLASSLKTGAIISNASKQDEQLIYDFGYNLGIAFQLQDDYLDVFGAEGFGKKVGGDIEENKKTFLYLKTLELVSGKDKEELQVLFSNKKNPENKVEKVKGLYVKYKISELLIHEIEKYSLKAFESVKKLSISNSSKEIFINLGKNLMYRDK
ncbi:MAG: polyprenyl synthetase family protein [Flavobacteriaceae bacterium]|nr:polyprenyl synthetase family protein [Flavobacteriaceae bacterium]